MCKCECFVSSPVANCANEVLGLNRKTIDSQPERDRESKRPGSQSGVSLVAAPSLASARLERICGASESEFVPANVSLSYIHIYIYIYKHTCPLEVLLPLE